MTKGKSYWLLSVLIASACGGRTSLLETLTEASSGSGGSGGSGHAGMPTKGGSDHGSAGTFSQAGTFTTGGTFAAAGTTTGGAQGECELALADCAAATEPACLGQRKPCTGDFLSLEQLDSGAGAQIFDVATSREGRVAVTGSFRGKLNVGGHVLALPALGDAPFRTAAFVASFDANGKAEWANVYEGDLELQGTGLRFAPNGDVVIQAVAIRYDKAPAAAVARLDPSGQLVWSKKWGQAGHITPGRLGVDNDGRIWLSGSFRSTFDFPGVQLESPLNARTYLLQLDEQGNAIRGFDAMPKGWLTSEAAGVTVDDEDNVLLVGQGQTDTGRQSAFFEKFSSSGELAFAKLFEGDVVMRGIAVDRMMRATLFGHFEGVFVNEGQKLDAGPVADNLWLAHYTREGALIWQRGYDGDAVVGVGTVDPFDNIIVTGNGGLVVDGKPLKSKHSADLGNPDLSFILKLRPDGAPVWTRTIDGAPTLYGAATDNDGYIWLAAQFENPIWVGESKLTASDISGLLLQMSP